MTATAAFVNESTDTSRNGRKEGRTIGARHRLQQEKGCRSICLGYARKGEVHVKGSLQLKVHGGRGSRWRGRRRNILLFFGSSRALLFGADAVVLQAFDGNQASGGVVVL
jgi:hypothetical protein